MPLIFPINQIKFQALKCELQQRTKLQQDINLLKQTKDALNKKLQGHNCKHVNRSDFEDVYSTINS